MNPAGRLTAAMFAGGVATFADLYAIQAVLPALSAAMDLSESVASLAISVATGALAVAVLPWAQVADRIGRTRAMTIAVLVAAAAGLALPFAPTVTVLLAVRAISGAALAAVPALAMAHLVEHAAPGRAAAMGGIYIAGTTLGGLSGRIVTGTVAGLVGGAHGWRWGLGATGVAVTLLAAAFAALLPNGEGTTPGSRAAGSRGRESAHGNRIRLAMASPAVWSLYGLGFLLMGGFVTVYNLLAFRLLAPPYRIPASLVSLLFVIYLVGTASSSAVGRFVGRFGRRPAMLAGAIGMGGGALLTMATPLALVIAGLVVVTFCFFVAHAIAAAWVGVLVPAARSQATALYSLAYYLGSSALGYLGALVFTWVGWDGAALMVTCCAALAVAVTATLGPGRRAA